MNDTIIRKKGKWYRTVNRYREDLGLSWEALLEMDSSTLKKCINKYDNDLWEQGIRNKKVLSFYALEKKLLDMNIATKLISIQNLC